MSQLSAPYVLVAGLALAGCGGDDKVQRSSRPARVATPPAAVTAGASRTPTATGGASSGIFTGQDVPTRFGDIQVSVTVAHGHITDVQWVKLPLDRPRSRYISQTAAPILRSEVLAAQSARIDALSGATYTSDAWANSVQSALAQMR